MINPAPMRANGTKTHVPSASSSSDFLNADRGDLLIRGFWEGSTDTIIDVHVTNLDSKSYKNLPPKKALERQEKEKKKKYCKPCEKPTSPFHTVAKQHHKRKGAYVLFKKRFKVALGCMATQTELMIRRVQFMRRTKEAATQAACSGNARGYHSEYGNS